MKLSPLENVRLGCRKVAEQAVYVRIDAEALDSYIASLPLDQLLLPQMDPAIHYLGHGQDTVAYYLTLDAVNFGSGYFPAILGDSRQSGYRTIAAALNDYFGNHGPIPPDQLRQIKAVECARIFRLELSNRVARELLELYTCALNDLGTLLCDDFDGEFSSLVTAAGQSAERLVEILISMPLFNDFAVYGEEKVPFYKRAQLTAVDLFIAFNGKAEGFFNDIDRITICADNLVPHVLRLDGILHYREDLALRIDQGEPLTAGSPEEVEIRACAVHAAELMVAALRQRGAGGVNAMLIDNFLWHRGQEPFYRASPRHRTLTNFY